MNASRVRTRAAGSLLVGLAVLTPLASQMHTASASTAGTAVLTAGTLGLTAPATVSFAATLNGVDQFVSATQSLDALDATGAAAGWNLTATSTTFTSGAHTLPATGVTEQSAPTQSCDGGVACTLATTNVSFPYTLPAAAVAPTATKIYNATAATGLGDQTSVHTLRLLIPAGAAAGTYSSTWTYSIVSGP